MSPQRPGSPFALLAPISPLPSSVSRRITRRNCILAIRHAHAAVCKQSNYQNYTSRRRVDMRRIVVGWISHKPNVVECLRAHASTLVAQIDPYNCLLLTRVSATPGHSHARNAVA